MQCSLLRLKSRSAREASRHVDFMGNYLTVTRVCFIYVADEFSFFSWFSWTKWTRWVNLKVYLFNQVEWGKEMGSRFLFATPGVWELPLRPTASAVRNFVCGVCRWLGWWWLVLGLLRVDITLGDGCGIWEHSCTVSGKWNISRVILRLMDGYIKPEGSCH